MVTASIVLRLLHRTKKVKRLYYSSANAVTFLDSGAIQLQLQSHAVETIDARDRFIRKSRTKYPTSMMSTCAPKGYCPQLAPPFPPHPALAGWGGCPLGREGLMYFSSYQRSAL